VKKAVETGEGSSIFLINPKLYQLNNLYSD